MQVPTEFTPLLAASLLGSTPLAQMPPDEIPEPYKHLLVHDRDMTSALAHFHGDAISLTILQSQHNSQVYFREVTLHAATTGAPVEYGLVKILLDSFPADLRPRILAGDTPLGTILTTSGLPFRSRPQGFFALPAHILDSVFPQAPTGKILFGRYNHLVGDGNTIFARIIEILPTPSVGVSPTSTP